MIISILLFLLASAFNALMDMTAQMWESSVIARKPKMFNPRWWSLYESYKHAPKILGTAVDAWHVAKFLMLACIIGSIATFTAEWYWVLFYPFIWGVGFETSKHFLTHK